MCYTQDDSHYEITSQVREQLKFLEGIDRVHTKRKQEQEREKLLKAAKVTYLSYICVLV